MYILWHLFLSRVEGTFSLDHSLESLRARGQALQPPLRLTASAEVSWDLVHLKLEKQEMT